MNGNENLNWEIIKSKNPLFNFKLKELWRYRDLLFLLVKRDLVAIYKQTILGPFWLIIQPILTTITFTIIFGRFAKISTDGVPPILFYLSGVIIWNYFSENLIKTSNTFISNANLFGKVYFPRLIIPISITISNIIALAVQFLLLLIIWVYYSFQVELKLSIYIFYLPLLLFILAGLGLGLGIIVSSLTTKYRDLRFLINFGTQLFMFLTPVIYPLSVLSPNSQKVLLLNPMTSVLEMFKAAFLGTEAPPIFYLMYSFFFTITTLFFGVLIFRRVERNFMDTV